MIYGEVNSKLDAVVELQIVGPDGLEAHVDAIIDTGFSEHLTLPTSIVDSLNLPLFATTSVKLGDGSIIEADVYRVRVKLGDQWTAVSMHQSEGNILAGMALLENTVLTIEVVRGGHVTVTTFD